MINHTFDLPLTPLHKSKPTPKSSQKSKVFFNRILQFINQSLSSPFFVFRELLFANTWIPKLPISQKKD
jgi:hypothetical protein